MNITVVDKEMMNFELTPVFEPFGYLGLGFGGRMLNTHMIVVWEGDNGSPVLSQRYGVGHVEPVVEAHPERVASLVPSTVDLRAKSNYSTIAFKIPYNKTEPRPGRIIWAYSLVRPDSDPSAQLTSHYVAGTVNMKLDKVLPGSTSPSKPKLEIQEPAEDMFDPLPRVQKLIWHGIFLSVGFLVLLPAGSLVARWSRTFTPRWFKLHRLINFGIALPVISCGFILAPLAVLNRQGSHFADAHQICGALLFALYIGQLFLGRYIHARKQAVPDRAPHPPANILHVLLGISVITLAFFQVYSGFKEWAKSTGPA
ncbi:hypothetical protein FB45DRAFT_502792 [Roridomyces roridus]|uniref:Cytochrome b561 domain-containing protein n=1 Tax=Roridomyces roridus TaxID=1738132 RepID=A0AAD7BWD3_9AGAR|nr:hypothetical protein FB45DRAFT_502792 [Roridomyces roridus]